MNKGVLRTIYYIDNFTRCMEFDIIDPLKK